MPVRKITCVAGLVLAMSGAATGQVQTGKLDLTGRTLTDLAAQLQQGHLTSEQIVKWYLDRIEAVDRNGPALRAVLAVNPQALDDARARDAERAAGHVRGPLHGVPVLVKDNIETQEPIATTAGSLALIENITHRDATLVAKLRAAGAIILGKTNLSEWANYRGARPVSGWSAVGGLTKNPYGLDRTPCGSSSGSGAGIAASLAAGAIGSETDGSITCPAAMNGVVGFKPTLGLVSRAHIVPLSHSQDTAGPMGHSVADVAALLSVIAGADAADPATRDAGAHAQDFTKLLDAGALKGKRLGVLRFETGFHPETDAVFTHALDILRAAGAELVDIKTLPGAEGIGPAEGLVLATDFKTDINAYLAQAPAGVASRSLADLIEFNKARPARELGLFGQELFEKAQATNGPDDPAYKTALAASKRLAGPEGIDRLMDIYHADALVAPTMGPAWVVDTVNGDPNTGNPTIGTTSLAAVAGYPHISVPMGAVYGLPVGLSIMGGQWQDGRILAFAYAFEQARGTLPGPEFPSHLVTVPALEDLFRPYIR